MNLQLNRSISYTYSWKATFLICLMLSGVLCFILIFLQPFDTYSVKMHYKNLKLAGYALPITVPILLIHLIENWWYRKQHKWLVVNELVVIIAGLLFITFSSFLYLNNAVNQTAVPWKHFFRWFKTFGLPFSPLLQALWSYLRFRFSKIALSIPQQKEEPLIEIATESSKPFQLYWDNFLLAEAQSNYVEIYCWNKENNVVEKELIRSSFSNFTNQLPKALQVHRSYLINPLYFEKLEGNSRKGWCYIQGIDKPIPVSPKHFKELKESLQNRP